MQPAQPCESMTSCTAGTIIISATSVGSGHKIKTAFNSKYTSDVVSVGFEINVSVQQKGHHSCFRSTQEDVRF